MEMEMEQIWCCKSVGCEGLPISVSRNNKQHPWLITQIRNDNGIVDLYSIGEQPSNYRCRIPELQQLAEIRIHGFCHGWMILSDYPHDVMWSLWNPVTSKLICLPPLARQDDHSDHIRSCCLSSPPGDPSSILLLTRWEKPKFVFCRLVDSCSSEGNTSRWTHMSYAKQLKRVMGLRGEEGSMLNCLTCCNGKVYALSGYTVVQIDIKVAKDKQVVINILPFQKFPPYPYFHSTPDFYVLKGSGTDLFVITGRYEEPAPAPAGFFLFKLDMTTTTATQGGDEDDDTAWEEIHDLKDAVFFVDMYNLVVVSYIPAVASGLGGYVHVRDFRKIRIHSFHVKDKTLFLLPMPILANAIQVSMWECRGLEDSQVKCTNDDKEEEEEEEEGEEEEEENKENDGAMTRSSNTNEEESRLLDVPFHVLEMIMEHCVGIEYMKLRATCKRCHLAAPRIHWRDKTALRKLQKYSLASPWLMVVEVNGGIMNFTDPISGDKYMMKLGLSVSHDDLNSICCSKYGWLLFYTCSSDVEFHQLVFFNPFTNDVRKLPPTPPHYLETLCFSAPPTSTDCMVVGFSTQGHAAYILRYVEDQQLLLWRRFDVDYGGDVPYAFQFPTFHGPDLYASSNEGQLVVFKDMREGSFHQPEVVAAQPPECRKLYTSQYFLMERDQYLLLVIVDTFGGDPQLFQFNDSTKEWNQIWSLERHVAFIGDATCVCVEAKTPEMQNNIYFQRFQNGKLIFYSLETSKYHTFDGKLATTGETFGFGMHLSLPAWIEPTWY